MSGGGMIMSMKKNGEVLPTLKRVVAKMTEQRNEEMRQLRADGWTLQKIGDKYGITRERVRQIVPNTAGLIFKQRRNYILSQKDKTNDELIEELGLCEATIIKYRGNTRHAVDQEYAPIATGAEWEEWAHNYLLAHKIENELQSYLAPYDIIALGNVYIDVKVTTTKTRKTSPKLKSPQYTFAPNTRHNKADIYMLIIAPSEDVFIVPANKIGNMSTVSFCWPSKRPEIGKIQKYYKRLDLIKKVHKQKNLGKLESVK
jgi:predicted DNA-binding protein YlxM (UPF0122 family)